MSVATISELLVYAVDREGSGIVFSSLGEILIRSNTQLVEDQLLQAKGGGDAPLRIVGKIVGNLRTP